MSEIKPCIFCGSKEIYHDTQNKCMICSDCYATGPARDERKDAQHDWNAAHNPGPKLLPCPFCDLEPRLVHHQDWSGYIRAECTYCDYQFPSGHWKQSEGLLVSAWNERGDL